MAASKVIAAVTLLTLASPAVVAAKVRNPTLYEQAQHLCYDDAMRLCNDAVPDEDKVQACMTKKRAQLSPACAQIFDQGSKD